MSIGWCQRHCLLEFGYPMQLYLIEKVNIHKTKDQHIMAVESPQRTLSPVVLSPFLLTNV